MSGRSVPRFEDVQQCSLCSSGKATFIRWTEDRLHRLPGRFGLVSCNVCGLVRLSPRPTSAELACYYPAGEYYSLQEPATSVCGVRPRPRVAQIRSAIRREVLTQLGYPRPQPRAPAPVRSLAQVAPIRRRALYGLADKFPRWIRAGRVLDVGSGSGEFLSYLAHHGWSVIGCDVSEQAARAAERAFRIKVLVGSLETVDLECESFDLVYFNHSIEHLYDPEATLRRAVALLKPGGGLYIETPNVASFNARVCGPYWFPLESPRHLYLFGADSLRRLVEGVDLSIEQLSTKRLRDVFAWEDTFRREEELGHEISPRPSLRRRRVPRAVFLRLAGRIVHAMRPLSEDTLWCWARKSPSSKGPMASSIESS